MFRKLFIFTTGTLAGCIAFKSGFGSIPLLLIFNIFSVLLLDYSRLREPLLFSFASSIGLSTSAYFWNLNHSIERDFYVIIIGGCIACSIAFLPHVFVFVICQKGSEQRRRGGRQP
jgi:hypothetical protein